MRSFLFEIGAIGVLAAIIGCTAAGEATPGEASLKEVDNDADSADRFMTIAADLRRCAAPLCGGYFVHEVNLNTDAQHVTKLIFEGRGLDQATITMIQKAPLQDLVLRGHLGDPEPRHHTRQFIVMEAYRGLPGKLRETSDTFFQVGKRVPPIACITTPCPNLIAAALNLHDRTDIDAVSLEGVALPLLQASWIDAELSRRGAVVAGDLNEPTSRPGTQRLLLAHQIYLRLPARVGPCRGEATPTCGRGQVATYTRDANRCMVFDRCVHQGVCPNAVPACPDGYTARAWNAAPSGCPAFACDPSFAAD